jgi:eukaryotic-like serine/threonine-protein kinase
MASGEVVSPKKIKFGGQFEVDLGAYELRKDGQPIKLGRIPMELLLFLIEQRGQLVTRDQIVEKIWGKDVFLDTDNSINAAIRRVRQVLEDNSDEPRYVQTVVGRGYRFIAAVEEAAEVAVSSPEAASNSGASPRPIWAWAGGCALVLLLLLSAFSYQWRPSSSKSATPEVSVVQARVRPSVAVIGFRNLAGKEKEAWISTALSEMVGSELAAGEQLRLIPSEDVARMKLDLALPTADNYGRETLRRIREHLGADVVVVGSYLALGEDGGGKIRVDLQLQDAQQGETIAVIQSNGTEKDLPELVSQSGTALRQKLGVGGLTTIDAQQIATALPSNAEAARLYAEGLGKLRTYDALAARDLLEKAIALDPKHAISHSALAQAWSALGYEAKATEQAKRALELSDNLPRQDRLAIEGNYRQLTRDATGAIEIYRTLSNFFPDNLDYGLHLASLQTDNSRPQDALQSIERLRHLPKPTSEDARIDLAEARASEVLGDFRRTHEFARSATGKAQEQGTRTVMAEAKVLQGWALERLGQLDAAEKELSEARELAAASGNPVLLATALRRLGGVLYDKDDFVGANKLFDEALTTFRKIGARRQVAVALINVGNVSYETGKLQEARRYYEEALKTDREIGSRPNEIASDLGSIANVLDGLGDLNGATRMQEESLQNFRQAGNKRGECTTLANLGNVLTERGELGPAMQAYDQAIALAQGIGYKVGHASYLTSSADVFLAQDNLPAARDRIQKALALRQELGNPVRTAVTQLRLASIAFEQGQVVEADNLVRSALPNFERDENDASLASAYLARILLAQSRVADAKSAAKRAESLSTRTNDSGVRFFVEVAVALANAADGHVAEAMKELERVRSTASQHGYAWFDFGARLELGKLELRSGKTNAGRARLEQLMKETQHKGFLLIARQASAALQPPHGRS